MEKFMTYLDEQAARLLEESSRMTADHRRA